MVSIYLYGVIPFGTVHVWIECQHQRYCLLDTLNSYQCSAQWSKGCVLPFAFDSLWFMSTQIYSLCNILWRSIRCGTLYTWGHIYKYTLEMLECVLFYSHFPHYWRTNCSLSLSLYLILDKKGIFYAIILMRIRSNHNAMNFLCHIRAYYYTRIKATVFLLITKSTFLARLFYLTN